MWSPHVRPFSQYRGLPWGQDAVGEEGPNLKKSSRYIMSVDRSSLPAKTREGAGKGAARRLRAQGMIPGVVYGRHLEKPLQVAIDPTLIKKAIATPHKFNTIITLKIDGQGDK